MMAMSMSGRKAAAKSLIALVLGLHSSVAVAFQLHSLQRWRCGDGICRWHAAPSKLSTAALPLVNDESYQNILPSSPKGVIFDMDGTLIQHSIDFSDMRQRIYAVADDDPLGKDLERDCIVALSNNLSRQGQEDCKLIFDDILQRAVDNMKPMHGGPELVQFLSENGLKCAVLTRNWEKNVSPMIDLYLAEIVKNNGVGSDSMNTVFHPIVASDTRSHPSNEEPLKSKPHPDGILHICNVWGCDPAEVIMVGDNANDDIMAANRARCGGAVLLTQPGGEQLDADSGYKVGDSEEEILERTPSLRVGSLFELKTCLEVLLNERDMSGESDQEKAESEQSNSDSFVYKSEGYSVEIPSIGVKNV